MSKDDFEFSIGNVGFLGLLIVSIIAGWMFVGPNYYVWSAQKNGEATLARANSERQIRVAEARAKKEAAELEAEAEVTRAQGAAKANEALGKSLNPQILQYLWIRALEENGNSPNEKQVIYIPTDPATGLPTRLPVTEANRLNGRATPNTDK